MPIACIIKRVFSYRPSHLNHTITVRKISHYLQVLEYIIGSEKLNHFSESKELVSNGVEI